MNKIDPFKVQQGTYDLIGTDAYTKDSEYFKALFEHPDMGRPWTDRVRGVDMVEDGNFQYRYTNGTTRLMYYYILAYGSGANYSVAYPGWVASYSTGPLAGWSTYDNDRMIATNDEGNIWLKPDGAPVKYHREGWLQNNWTWTHLSGGPLGGTSLEDACKDLIGAENGALYFMQNSSTVLGYNVDNGVYTASNEWAFPASSDLAGLTLGDVIDGKEPGYLYLGWSDNGPVVMKGEAFIATPSVTIPVRDTDEKVVVTAPEGGAKPAVDAATGAVIVPEDCTVSNADGDPITDSNNNTVPAGSVVTPGGMILLPATDGALPQINDGEITVPEDGRVLYYQPPWGEWILQDGATVTADGMTANSEPAVDATTGDMRFSGNDGLLFTEDDFVVTGGTPPVIDTETGYMTVPEDGRVIDTNGEPIAGGGSVITGNGTIITSGDNGVLPVINPDGTVDVPPGASVITCLPPWVANKITDGGTWNPDTGIDIDNPGADGRNWYVDWNNGDDLRSGRGSWDNAKKNIQAAIDLADPGDTINVRKGTYAPISTGNKTLLIIARDPVAETIIDGGNTTRVATLADREGDYLFSYTNTVLSGFTLTNGNASGNYGGGAQGGTLVDCVVSGNASRYGGGAAGSFVLNSTLANNTAYQGGGAHSCLVVNSTIRDNTASATGATYAYGGGARMSVIRDCDIFGNQTAHPTAASRRGGGVSDCDVYTSRIHANSAYHGGGAHNSNLTDCDIYDNQAVDYGGGSYYDGTASAKYPGLVTRCRIHGHILALQDGTAGGGVYRGTVTDSKIYGNQAFRGGGVCGASAATYAIVDRSTLTGNTAQYGGGAMWTKLSNTLLVKNTAKMEGGGCYDAIYGLVNCTVADNHAGTLGGGVAVTVATATFNNIFANNTSGGDKTYTQTYSPVIPNSATTGNLTTAAPGFVGSGDYHLLADSPCIAAGAVNRVNTLLDRDGNPRLTGNGATATVCIGAYEGIADYLRLPGANGSLGDADDPVLWPTDGAPAPVTDANGYVTVDDTTSVRSADGDPIVRGNGAPLQPGAIVTSDGFVITTGDNNAAPSINPGTGAITIPPGAGVITYDPEQGKWVEQILEDGGEYIPGQGVKPGQPDDGTITNPGKDGTEGTDDDINITPPAGGAITPDENGHITVPEGGSVTDSNGNPITDNNGDKVPEGSVITPDGTIILPNENGDKPVIDENGTVTIPEGGSTITWNEDDEEWQETEFPDGGEYIPGEGAKPNPGGNNNTVIHPGKDGADSTEDDIQIVLPEDGSLLPDANGNTTIPDGATVNDANGKPITGNNGGTVPPGAIITPGGTIVLPGAEVQPDGSITFPGGGSIITWNEDDKEWQETEIPQGGTLNPDDNTVSISLLITAINVRDDLTVDLTWTPPAGIDAYILLAKVKLTDAEWIPLTEADLPELGDPATTGATVPADAIPGDTSTRFFTLQGVIIL